MKKQFLLMASAAFLLTSCGGETKTEDAGQSQAQIDSAVNAQVAEREAEMARKNDSTLKAMEAEKAAADSAAAAAEAASKKSSGGKKTTKTPKAEPASPAPPPPPPPPANPKEDRFKDQSQKTVDPNAPNKKADRFK
jgi:hypothetical protein